MTKNLVINILDSHPSNLRAVAVKTYNELFVVSGRGFGQNYSVAEDKFSPFRWACLIH